MDGGKIAQEGNEMDTEQLARLCNARISEIIAGFQNVLTELKIPEVTVVAFKLKLLGVENRAIRVNCHPCLEDPTLTCCDPE